MVVLRRQRNGIVDVLIDQNMLNKIYCNLGIGNEVLDDDLVIFLGDDDDYEHCRLMCYQLKIYRCHYLVNCLNLLVKLLLVDYQLLLANVELVLVILVMLSGVGNLVLDMQDTYLVGNVVAADMQLVNNVGDDGMVEMLHLVRLLPMGTKLLQLHYDVPNKMLLLGY